MGDSSSSKLTLDKSMDEIAWKTFWYSEDNALILQAVEMSKVELIEFKGASGRKRCYASLMLQSLQTTRAFPLLVS